MADQTASAARAWLFKRGIRHISPARLAAAANETGKDFGELIFLIGLLHDGPSTAEAVIRDRTLGAESLKEVRKAAPQ